MTEPVAAPRTYYATFAGLIALTFLTVGLSFADLGAWHLAVGLSIGAAKAGLVVLFFMHLWHAPRLTWLAAGVGLFWLGILLALTLTDYLTRHRLAY